MYQPRHPRVVGSFDERVRPAATSYCVHTHRTIAPIGIFALARLLRSRKRRSRLIIDAFVVLAMLLGPFSTNLSIAKGSPTFSPLSSAPTSSLASPDSTSTDVPSVTTTPPSTYSPTPPSATSTSPAIFSATPPTTATPLSTTSVTPSSTASPTTSPTSTITVSVTPPPPTYTVGTPTVVPTISPIPDTNYVQQGADAARDSLLAQINALPILTGTITGTLVSGASGGRVPSDDGALTLAFITGTVDLTETINVSIQRLTFTEGDPEYSHNGNKMGYTYRLTATDHNGNPVTQFNKDVGIVWNIDFADLQAQGVIVFPLFVS